MSVRWCILLLALALGSVAEEVPKVLVDPYPLAKPDSFSHLSLVLENPLPRFEGRLRVVFDAHDGRHVYEQPVKVGQGVFRFHLYPLIPGIDVNDGPELQLLPAEGDEPLWERRLPLLRRQETSDWQVLVVTPGRRLASQHIEPLVMNRVAFALAQGEVGREWLTRQFEEKQWYRSAHKEVTQEGLAEARSLADTDPLAALELLLEMDDDAVEELQEDLDAMALELMNSIPLPAEPFIAQVRQPTLAHMRAETLPDRWFGYAEVGTIIWDVSMPSRLESAQRQALDEWVRQGGNLVLWQDPAVSLRYLPMLESLPAHPERGWERLPRGFGSLTLATLTEAEWLELERQQLVDLLICPPDLPVGFRFGEATAIPELVWLERIFDNLIGFVPFNLWLMWGVGLLVALGVSLLDWWLLRKLGKFHWTWVTWPLLVVIGCGVTYLVFYKGAELPQEARIEILDVLPEGELVRELNLVALRHRSQEPVTMQPEMQNGVSMLRPEGPYQGAPILEHHWGETRQLSIQQSVGALSLLLQRPPLRQAELQRLELASWRPGGDVVTLTYRVPAGWEKVTPIVCWRGIHQLSGGAVGAFLAQKQMPPLPQGDPGSQVLVLLVRERGEARMEVIRQLVEVPP